jgi:hypothetical protein
MTCPRYRKEMGSNTQLTTYLVLTRVKYEPEKKITATVDKVNAERINSDLDGFCKAFWYFHISSLEYN